MSPHQATVATSYSVPDCASQRTRRWASVVAAGRAAPGAPWGRCACGGARRSARRIRSVHGRRCCRCREGISARSWCRCGRGEPQPWCRCSRGEPQPWCRCGRGEPQPWCRCGRGEPQPWCRCGRGEPQPWCKCGTDEPNSLQQTTFSTQHPTLTGHPPSTTYTSSCRRLRSSSARTRAF